MRGEAVWASQYDASWRVNREKSRVDRAARRTFLGFGFMVRDGRVKVRV